MLNMLGVSQISKEIYDNVHFSNTALLCSPENPSDNEHFPIWVRFMKFPFCLLEYTLSESTQPWL